MLKSITSGLRRVFKSDAQDDDENQGRFSEILKWAEENNIGEDRIPREPSELIGLNRLDLSFRRLQSLRLGYKLPKVWLSKVGIRTASLSAEARNLLVLASNYNNYLDPETMGNPFAQPLAKSFIFGLNVQF